MANYRFPGVYPNIRDLSGIVTINASTSCGYVGEAPYGPVFKPTLCSTLQDYTDRFGPLSSQYGYAGYSLAVASETINEHYFVRVVNTGSENDEDRSNNAKWAAGAIMQNDFEYQETSESGEIISNRPYIPGYFYEKIVGAQNLRDSGSDCGLFRDDEVTQGISDASMIFAATDPNARDFYITIEDSTINENVSYSILDMTVVPSNEGIENYALVTYKVDATMLDGIDVGDKVVITKVTDSKFNGLYEIESMDVDPENKNVKLFTVTVPFGDKDPSEHLDPGFTSARARIYPANNETTFRVIVEEKIGRVFRTLEIYDYCTLYPAQDNYGNSTFVEDVINVSSNYIQVFVNTDVTENNFIIPEYAYRVNLEGGNPGSWGKGQYNEKIDALCDGWEYFRDRTQVNVSLLMNSGYVSRSNVSYQNKMIEIAEHRRDCFCLLDVPLTDTAYNDAVDFRQDMQQSTSYRAALCTPWVKTYDAAQGRSNFLMCPSAYIAKIMGTGEPWMAPAGLNRGVLSSTIVSPTGLTDYYNTIQGGVLYTDNQMNCLIKDAAVGYVSWGQRTLQKKPSALDRINVARTVIYIETVLRDAARWHLFENNTAYERMQITLQFTSFLNTILSAEGIQRLQVICDESNNTPAVISNNQLVVDIYLWPSYTAEVIILNTNVMGADTTVNISTYTN